MCQTDSFLDLKLVGNSKIITKVCVYRNKTVKFSTVRSDQIEALVSLEEDRRPTKCQAKYVHDDATLFVGNEQASGLSGTQ